MKSEHAHYIYVRRTLFAYHIPQNDEKEIGDGLDYVQEFGRVCWLLYPGDRSSTAP